MDIKEGVPSYLYERLLLPDDDSTFAPPPLSAYSIALLSDHSNPTINTIKFKENSELRSSLKSKLSVHFSESADASRANTSHNSNLSHNLSYNLSTHSLNRSQSENQNENYSGNQTSNHSSNHSTSGHQNSSSTSFSSASNHQDEDMMNISGELQAKSMHTTPGGLPSVNRSFSNGYSGVKRSRLARRFKSLGPPKRASEVPDLDESLADPSDDAHPKRVLTISPADDSKRKVNNSNFFKTLEKLKLRSPNLDLLGDSQDKREEKVGKYESEKGIRKDFDKMIESSFSALPKKEPSNNPFQKPSSRFPLNSVSPNVFNIERDFRKPRTPKVARDPTPAVYKLPVPSNNDEAKRRKIIHINSQQYEKLELLGRGGTSKVYKVRSLSTKQVFAIKKVSFDQFDDACVKGFKGEIDLLNKLKDQPRVVKLIDHTVCEGSIFLVMECGDLDLARVLQTKLAEGKLDFCFVKFHAMELLRCVEAVHRAGIVHSDLKPANFLFVKGIMKVIDFGIANAVPDHTSNIYRESQIGTPNYMAPEALVEVNHTLLFSSKLSQGNTWKVGRPSDIWSCGCIVYQMIYGRPPYGSYSGQLRITAIMNPQVKIEYPSKGLGGVPVPISAVELMRNCLARNPHERWTVEQCMNCDFLRPRAVSRAFVKDLVYSAVNFGYNNRDQPITDDVYEKLVETVLQQIDDLNYV